MSSENKLLIYSYLLQVIKSKPAPGTVDVSGLQNKSDDKLPELSGKAEVKEKKKKKKKKNSASHEATVNEEQVFKLFSNIVFSYL